MIQFLSKFLDSNEKQITRLSKVVASINAVDDSRFTLENLPKKTQKLKEYFADQLHDILMKDEISKEDVEKIKKVLYTKLPEAFAMVRRAAELTTTLRHFDEQLLGGIALFEGRLAELATGEGKTFVGTLPLFIYALCGQGAHIVTVNDYLVKRDAEWCGHIYDALGLTTGVITSGKAYTYKKDVPGYEGEEKIDTDTTKIPKLNEMHGLHLVECTKKEAYACDVTYCTNNELGFDYLRDNMAVSLDAIMLRRLFFCIVDEADSVLIDESRTPLIISIPASQSNDLYTTFAQVVQSLNKDKDYTVDEKQRRVIITDEGIDKVERLLNVKNIWEDFLLAHHLENALAAKELYKNGDEYIVKEGQVLIVDEFTGRILEGRRFSEGMHQAIEAKEGVVIKEEQKTTATITFQNLFRLYAILAGMTGTAMTEAEEFSKIYHIDAISIPTHRKVIRQDRHDVIYKTEKAKFLAVAKDIEERHKKGQPVLVGTVSVEKSEELSKLLVKRGLVHEVLNAKHHEREAEIISHAGEKGQITISTNMAGRGTDITLGGGVKELGGLSVIGTERHESRRIDNQLRGRSGRQGDPGETRFYVSLEDNLMRIFGGARIASIMTGLKMDENIPLEVGVFSKQIESAQKKVEHMYFDARKHIVEYDDVLNIQREVIYKRRRYVLQLFSYAEGEDPQKAQERKQYITEKVAQQIDFIIDAHAMDGEVDTLAFEKVTEEMADIFPSAILEKILARAETTPAEWYKLLTFGGKKIIAEKIKEQYDFLIDEAYAFFEEQFTPHIFAEKNKWELLRVIDILWVEHLDSIEALKEAIALSVYAQKDPLIEYKNQAYILFEDLINAIEAQMVRNLFKAEPVQIAQPQIVQPLEIVKPLEVISDKPVPGKQKQKQKSDGKKIGRNDLCPCGSGKKYKKCGEINSPEHQARMAQLSQ